MRANLHCSHLRQPKPNCMQQQFRPASSTTLRFQFFAPSKRFLFALSFLSSPFLFQCNFSLNPLFLLFPKIKMQAIFKHARHD